MERWYTKAKRGDVWYISLNRETGDSVAGSSVQQKSRPYLIVSEDIHNRTSTTLNAVPITTRPKDDYPMHVYFHVDGEGGGRNQVVLCEQITTLSQSLLEKTYSHFMYHMTDDFMNKVDAALAKQLGLSLKIPEWADLESLIDRLAEKKLEEIRRKNDEEVGARVQKITEALKEKFLDKTQPIRQTTQETNLNEADREVLRTHGQIRHKGDLWTKDTISLFLKDVQTYTSAQISAMYGIAQSSIAPTVNKFKNKKP